MSSFRLSARAASAAADAVTALLDGGALRLYGDGPQPQSVDDAVTRSSRLLADLSLGAPAFRPAVNGRAEAVRAVSGQALATGRASWFRAVSNAGRPVFDGSIGGDRSGADLELGTTAIELGAEILITAMIYRQP